MRQVTDGLDKTSKGCRHGFMALKSDKNEPGKFATLIRARTAFSREKGTPEVRLCRLLICFDFEDFFDETDTRERERFVIKNRIAKFAPHCRTS